MLKDYYHLHLKKELTDTYGLLTFSHLQTLESRLESIEKQPFPDQFEYVFRLIHSSFLHISPYGCYFPVQEEDKTYYMPSFNIFSLPFKDETKVAEIEQWNDLVKLVSDDFAERRDSALRGNCTLDKLDSLIKDCLEDFDYPDRIHLDPEKLLNLVIFVYDYCILTMKEAHLHYDLDYFVKGEVSIRKKTYYPPHRVCASIAQYLPLYANSDKDEWPDVGYKLPALRQAPIVQNPHASDSCVAAMFTDLMHKFFLSYGLQKRGNSEWAKAEKWLIYELLRILGLCKSSKPAKESKYVTTVMNDYGDYFSSCNLRAWIRQDQAYSYLMPCSEEVFVRKGQSFNLPIIPLDCYEGGIENHVKEEHTDAASDTQEAKTDVITELPEDLKKPLEELAGHSFTITHADFIQSKYEYLSYASIESESYEGLEEISWDPRLDYVIDLIRSSFDYITFFPSIPKYLVVRNDLKNPKVFAKLVESLKHDLLERIEDIPRGIFQPKDIIDIIDGFRNPLPREDRARFDTEKAYVLFLFIYDYVYVTYKEATITPHLRLFNQSKLQIYGNTFPSTVLIDDMLVDLLNHIFTFIPRENEKELYQELAGPNLFVPRKCFPVELSSCTVKNMTAMFYDLFARFFRTLGLTRRKDVKVVSTAEDDLICNLVHSCGLCASDNNSSIRRMYMENKDYFEKSSLELVIRENEYGYLMINTMSDHLFSPKTQPE